MPVRVPVPEEDSQRFTEIAHGARLMWKMHATVGDPAPGSYFDRVAELYPYEKVSDRSQAYLDAAFEHLLLWADYVAPFKFHPEQVTNFTLRPAYTLARAALESAAQTVWMLGTADPLECVRRHLSLMRWDLHEHAKSKSDPTEKQRIRDMDADLVRRVSQVFPEKETRAPGGYLQVLQAACSSDSDLRISGQEVERIWRRASGSAHGKYWPKIDLQHAVPGEEYEPGHYRAVLYPDTAGMVEALDYSFRMTQIGALRHADWSGANIENLLAESKAWLAEQITLRPDADPGLLEHFRLDRDADN